MISKEIEIFLISELVSGRTLFISQAELKSECYRGNLELCILESRNFFL